VYRIVLDTLTARLNFTDVHVHCARGAYFLLHKGKHYATRALGNSPRHKELIRVKVRALCKIKQTAVQKIFKSTVNSLLKNNAIFGQCM
jgi:hypothetical protein